MSSSSKLYEIIDKTIGRVAIIAVPLFFAVSELIHPISQETIMGEIESAKTNSLSWFISHILQLFAIVFLPFLIQKLICFIDEKKIKLSMFGITLSYIGIIGVTGLLIYDLMLWDAWKVGNYESIAKFFEILNSSVFGLMFLLLGPIVFLMGFITLITLIIISDKIKTWKSLTIFMGLLIYGLAGPLVSVNNGHIIVSIGAIIMLIGFIGVLIEDITAV